LATMQEETRSPGALTGFNRLARCGIIPVCA
jgi:hypothetical protein